MWIYLPDAFYSVVQDRHDATRLLVRARFAGDIERHFPEATVVELRPGESDYRFRASLNRTQVVGCLAASMWAIDYSNFKAQVPPEDALRSRAYLRVWVEMNEAQACERDYGHTDLLDPR